MERRDEAITNITSMGRDGPISKLMRRIITMTITQGTNVSRVRISNE